MLVREWPIVLVVAFYTYRPRALYRERAVERRKDYVAVRTLQNTFLNGVMRRQVECFRYRTVAIKTQLDRRFLEKTWLVRPVYFVTRNTLYAVGQVRIPIPELSQVLRRMTDRAGCQHLGCRHICGPARSLDAGVFEVLSRTQVAVLAEDPYPHLPRFPCLVRAGQGVRGAL